MDTATVICILLAVTALARTLPSNDWSSVYKYRDWANSQQQARAQQCRLTLPVTSSCKTAHVFTHGGRQHSQIHVCPESNGGFCVNTKVPLCCASNPEVYTTDNLTFVNTTTLRVVGGQDITVTIFQNKGAEHCYYIDDSNINSCCDKAETYLDCRCVPYVPPGPEIEIPEPVIQQQEKLLLEAEIKEAVEEVLAKCTGTYPNIKC